MKIKKAYLLIVLFLCGLSVGNVCASASVAAKKAGYLGVELRAAAREDDKTEVEELIAAGADVNAQDRLGWTALMRAAWRGDADIMKLLLDEGADKDIQNRYGETAEDIARKAGHAKLANIIRDYAPSGGRIKSAGKR